MYKLTDDPTLVTNLDTNELIPQGSRHWDDYQAWLDAGNTPEPENDLTDSIADKLEELSNACANAIVSGFTSSALGTAYTYPSKPNDQRNLDGSVLDSVLATANNETDWTTPFWCMDSNGNWAFMSHTIAQIQQVGRDGKQYILSQMAHNATLGARVSACTTIDQVAAITWDSN